MFDNRMLFRIERVSIKKYMLSKIYRVDEETIDGDIRCFLPHRESPHYAF